MGYFAGIDVGVKNLCWCIIDTEVWKQYQKEPENKNPGIVAWKNINLIDTKYCEGVFKSGKKKGETCGKLASFYSGKKEYYWCGTHKPDDAKKFKQQNSKSKPVGVLLERAFEQLDEETVFSQVNSIAIELQLKKNPTMKRRDMQVLKIPLCFIHVRCLKDVKF
jgi:hypothetical protein